MSNKKNTTKALFAYSGLGIQLALYMIVFVYGGYKLDKYCDSSPWFVLAGALIGISSGLYSFIKGVQRMNKTSRKEGEDQDRTKWL